MGIPLYLHYTKQCHIWDIQIITIHHAQCTAILPSKHSILVMLTLILGLTYSVYTWESQSSSKSTFQCPYLFLTIKLVINEFSKFTFKKSFNRCQQGGLEIIKTNEDSPRQGNTRQERDQGLNEWALKAFPCKKITVVLKDYVLAWNN